MKSNNYFVPTTKKNYTIALSSSILFTFIVILQLIRNLIYYKLFFLILAITYFASFYRIFEYLLTGKSIGGYPSLFFGPIVTDYDAQFYFYSNFGFAIVLTAVLLYFKI